MPPKRRAPARQPAPKRPSRLAKEHGLTADQEAEIREAFGLFAIQHPDHADSPEGVLRRDDVRRCLISLNLAPSRAEIPTILSTIDPLKTGVVPFDPFIAYAAIALHTRDDSEGDGDEDEEDDEATPYRRSGDDEEQVREAYMLFTHGGPGPITLAHLRRVARELREDVPDDVLKDMLREANGGVAANDAGGVALAEFESVLRRAGVSFG